MHPARIAELLDPFLRAAPTETAESAPHALSTAQLQAISTYIDILSRWNARINLTAIRDEEDIVTRHFGESLFAARHLFPLPHARLSVADLGSGAGFPGLPMKIWAPQISLTLIESNHKKAAFLSEVARALTLTDINVQNARAESLPPAAFHVVTLRAVERFESILPTAGALVAPAGRLALLIGSAQQAQAQGSLPHFTWSQPIPIPNSRSRVLLVANLPQGYASKWSQPVEKDLIF